LYLHSILLNDDPGSRNIRELAVDSLPYKVRRNLESFIVFHPNHTHTLWTNQSITELIYQSFGGEVFKAYNLVVPLAYKADLARYCILYKYGGIYSDLSFCFFSSLYDSMGVNAHVTITNSDSLILFRDAFTRIPWIVSNSLIYCQPHHRLFDECIARATYNILNHVYGDTPLCPTGPSLLGACLVKCSEYEILPELVLGRVLKIHESPTHERTYAYLGYNGKFVGVIHKDDKGLTSLGLPNNQDYSQMHFLRRCYGEPSFPIRFQFTDYVRHRWIKSEFKCLKDRVEIILGSQDTLIYGPYVNLDSGTYVITFTVETPPKDVNFYLLVKNNFGSTVLSATGLSLETSSNESTSSLIARRLFIIGGSNIEFVLCHDSNCVRDLQSVIRFRSICIDLDV
jgi:hypothetical protein